MEQKQFKILAVDDNLQNIKVIGSILRKANYQVGFAFNGKQALELLRESPDYDLVLLDVNMPVMNGYEACEQIRKDPWLTGIPVIFLTALSEIDNVVRGFDAGGQDYVGKPFNSRELLARVQTHVELKTSREQLRENNDILEKKVKERTRELRKVNERLLAVNRELELLDQAKADFLGIISHEINTPLNGIIGFTNILKEKLKQAEFYEMIDFLDTSAKRLEKFANFSLLITELRANEKKLKPEFFPIAERIAEHVAHFKDKFDEKQLDVVVDCQVKLLYGDQSLIDKSLECVLDNAIRYSTDQGTVQITVYRENSCIVCEFEDTGKGFPPEILHEPFKLFSYGREYMDEQKGLSLAFVNLVMKAHQGKVELSNSEKGGAVVRLYFKNS